MAGDSHGSSGLAMTLAHVAAAVVSAWWLRRGERAAWALARRFAALADRPIRLLRALLDSSAVPAAPVRFVPVTAETVPTERVLRHLVVRRGPPSRSRVLAHG
jgi:hypothetical protein